MIIIKIYLSSRIKLDFLKKSQKKLEVLEMKNKKIYCKTLKKMYLKKEVVKFQAIYFYRKMVKLQIFLKMKNLKVQKTF